MKTLFPALTIAVLSVGCYYDTEEKLYPGLAPCELADVTWSETIRPIIQTRCAISGCHVQGGNGPGDYSQFTNVKAAADQGFIRIVVIDNRSMPPGIPLNDCQLEQIGIWLDAGAPEN
jgi:hypothetical protein